MPQHASEACNESNGLWLPITEYSVKSGVSLSTIRRKIKSNTIQYRLEKGKYFILFNDANNMAMRHTALVSFADSSRRQEVPFIRKPVAPPTAPSERVEKAAENPWDMPVDKAVRMVSDAFEHALKEKDERIRLLEQRNSELDDRLNELRLLVRVLEEKYEVRY